MLLAAALVLSQREESTLDDQPRHSHLPAVLRPGADAVHGSEIGGAGVEGGPAGQEGVVRTRKQPSVLSTVLAGTAAGLLASWVKSQDEPLLQKVAEQIAPPTPPQKGLPAADSGNDQVMPPALVVDKAHKLATGIPASAEQKSTGMQLLHYGMGTGQAVAYFLAVRRWPALTAGFGTAFGAAAFLGTHASTLPAMGVQTPPQQLPTSWWIWEGGSHLAFGASVEGLRRLWLSRA